MANIANDFKVPIGTVIERIKKFNDTERTVADFKRYFPNVKVLDREELPVRIGKLHKGELRYVEVGNRVFLTDLK